MKSRVLALISLFTVVGAAHAAAPTEFNGYCMVVQQGSAPGMDVNLKYGESVTINTKGTVNFKVSYGDALNEKNVFQLVIVDSVAGKQSVTDVFVGNEFPKRIDHVSEMGTISCMRYFEADDE